MHIIIGDVEQVRFVTILDAYLGQDQPKHPRISYSSCILISRRPHMRYTDEPDANIYVYKKTTKISETDTLI